MCVISNGRNPLCIATARLTTVNCGIVVTTMARVATRASKTRTTCADAATEIGCVDNAPGGSQEQLSLVVQGGVPLDIFVDGFQASGAGPYTLDVAFTPAVCGDSTRVAPEECDDGNTTSGDGCDATCKIEYALYCSAAMPATASNMGDTTGGSSVFSGSCTGSGAPERLYTYTAPADGTLEVRLLSATDQGFYVRKVCGDATTEVGCAEMVSGGATEYLSLGVSSGETFHVIVEAYQVAEAGPYTLTLDWNP